MSFTSIQELAGTTQQPGIYLQSGRLRTHQSLLGNTARRNRRTGDFGKTGARATAVHAAHETAYRNES